MIKLLWCSIGLVLMATVTRADPAPNADADVERGHYLARAGDCAACHTAPGGKEFAGGRALSTPLGTVYSSNITPDPSTGIGSYTLDDFSRALREGVAKDGTYLYPAMPFPSYAKITDADIRDLYAYFQRGVTPVEQADRRSGIPFPLNVRFPLFFWDALFLHKGEFQPEDGRDAQWNRGAYLVEGLGHCGACHTPRAVTLEEEAVSERDGTQYLAGAVVEGWYAKSLRGGRDGLGQWTEADIVMFLKAGSTERTAAFGNMAEVVQHSTQYLTDDDLGAIAGYLKSLSAHAGEVAVSSARGRAWYEELCVTCHRPDGSGLPHIFPALAGNDVVQTADVISLVHIVLSGGRRPPTGARPAAYAMPAFETVDDRELAEIVTYIRTAWDNSASPISGDKVAALRSKFSPVEVTPTPPTPPNLVKFAPPHIVDIPNDQSSGQIDLGRRLLAETKKLLPNNVGAALNCDSCHLGGGRVANASPYYGMAVNYPRENPRAGRVMTLAERINGCMLRSMNGKPLAPDSAEMKAMVAYLNWMSAGLPQHAKVDGAGIGKVDTSLAPDPVHGKELYGAKCAECHGTNGDGLKDARGESVVPPLWGDASFNIGAGMARTYTAATFIKHNMPIGYGLNAPLGQGGALSDQEAIDIADYFTHQPRPDFAAKDKDWPNGGKPKDTRY